MPRLSVIVPVYNVEAFLPACIESILHQTLQDLELILIDDGSPDRCGSICDEYAARDSRIKVIHQTNHGVSYARNAGLRIAAGDYLGFVDPDDLVAPEMYANLIREAETNACDIAICGFAYCAEDGSFLREEPIPTGVISQRELLLSIYGMPNPFHGSMCNKLFTRKILSGLEYDESVAIGEDWLLLYDCYERASKAISVEGCFYTIRLRDNSATRKHNAELYMKKLETYQRLFHYSKGKDREIQKRATDKILDTYLNNKDAIIKADYNRKCLMQLNLRMMGIAVSSFLRGNLSFKRTIYHLLKGLQY